MKLSTISSTGGNQRTFTDSQSSGFSELVNFITLNLINYLELTNAFQLFTASVIYWQKRIQTLQQQINSIDNKFLEIVDVDVIQMLQAKKNSYSQEQVVIRTCVGSSLNALFRLDSSLLNQLPLYLSNVVSQLDNRIWLIVLDDCCRQLLFGMLDHTYRFVDDLYRFLVKNNYIQDEGDDQLFQQTLLKYQSCSAVQFLDFRVICQQLIIASPKSTLQFLSGPEYSKEISTLFAQFLQEMFKSNEIADEKQWKRLFLLQQYLFLNEIFLKISDHSKISRQIQATLTKFPNIYVYLHAEEQGDYLDCGDNALLDVMHQVSWQLLGFLVDQFFLASPSSDQVVEFMRSCVYGSLQNNYSMQFANGLQKLSEADKQLVYQTIITDLGSDKLPFGRRAGCLPFLLSSLLKNVSQIKQQQIMAQEITNKLIDIQDDFSLLRIKILQILRELVREKQIQQIFTDEQLINLVFYCVKFADDNFIQRNGCFLLFAAAQQVLSTRNDRKMFNIEVLSVQQLEQVGAFLSGNRFQILLMLEFIGFFHPKPLKVDMKQYQQLLSVQKQCAELAFVSQDALLPKGSCPQIVALSSKSDKFIQLAALRACVIFVGTEHVGLCYFENFVENYQLERYKSQLALLLRLVIRQNVGFVKDRGHPMLEEQKLSGTVGKGDVQKIIEKYKLVDDELIKEVRSIAKQ